MGNLIYQIESNLAPHAYCGAYSVFCIFSDSRASSLEEAQSSCKKIHNKSWPAELDSWRFEEVFQIYVQNYSINNVIMNAQQNSNGTWEWIKAKEGVISMSNLEGGDFLVYDKQDSVPDYSVVCMLECRASWKDYKSVGLNLVSFIILRSFTGIDGCKRSCNKFTDCAAVDVKPFSSGTDIADCLLYDKVHDPEKFVKKKGSHHVIDRSTKTIERCIGTAKRPDYTYLMMAIGLLTLMMLLLCLILYLKCCGQAPRTYSTESSAIPSN